MGFISLFVSMVVLGGLIAYDYRTDNEIASAAILVVIIYSIVLGDMVLLISAVILLPVYRALQPLTRRIYLESGGLTQALISLAYPLVYIVVPSVTGYYLGLLHPVGFDKWALGFYVIIALALALASIANPRIRDFILSRKLLYPDIAGVVKAILTIYWLATPIVAALSIEDLGLPGAAALLILLGEYLAWRRMGEGALRLLILLLYPSILMILVAASW